VIGLGLGPVHWSTREKLFLEFRSDHGKLTNVIIILFLGFETFPGLGLLGFGPDKEASATEQGVPSRRPLDKVFGVRR